MTPAQDAVFAVLWLVVLTLGGLVLLLYSQVDKAYRSAAMHQSAGLLPGTEAPDFQILTTDGAVPLPLPAAAGDPYILAFINSACSRCKDLIEQAAKRPRSDGRIIFLLTHGRGYPDIVERLPPSASLHPLAYPEDVMREFGVTVYPFVYVMRGKTVLAGRSVVTDVDMAELLHEAAHNEEQWAAERDGDGIDSRQVTHV